MAILAARSWDCGNTMINDADKNATVSVSQNAHTGGYSLQIGASSGSWARVAVPGVPASPSTSIWVYCSSFHYSDSGLLRLYYDLDTAETISLRWNATTHTFDAYVDGGLVEAGTVEVSAEGWFHCQFRVVISDTGSIQVKIDGHLSIDYAGDTKPGTAAGAAYFRMNAGYVGASAALFDDLVIDSGVFLGDLRCIDKRPVADTAQDDYTPSAGDNYSTIDETPASDADYNETYLDAQADELALEDFDGVTYTPVAVTAWIRAKMGGATGDSIKVGIDSGGVNDVTEHALSTAYEYYFHTNDENPNGSVAWNDAAIDALLLRYESVIA